MIQNEGQQRNMATIFFHLFCRTREVYCPPPIRYWHLVVLHVDVERRNVSKNCQNPYTSDAGDVSRALNKFPGFITGKSYFAQINLTSMQIHRQMNFKRANKRVQFFTCIYWVHFDSPHQDVLPRPSRKLQTRSNEATTLVVVLLKPFSSMKWALCFLGFSVNDSFFSINLRLSGFDKGHNLFLVTWLIFGRFIGPGKCNVIPITLVIGFHVSSIHCP